MDPTVAGFYSVICAALAALAPYFGRLWVRVVCGAIVGLGAAFLLPMVRAMVLGY